MAFKFHDQALKPGSPVAVWHVPAILFALNFVLKYLHLTTVQIGLDEPFSIFHAQMPPDHIVEELTKGNNPPLNELLLHVWMGIFGDSVAAVRFPSLLAACFTAVLLYHIGYHVRGFWVGILGAVAYTLTTEHTYFAHEARIYAIWAMLSAASVLLLLRLRERPRFVRHWALFILVNAAMIWGHYFGFIVLGLEAGWIFLARHPQKWDLVKGGLISWAVTAAAYLPHAGVILNRAGVAVDDHWVGPSSFPGLYSVLAKYANQPVVAVTMLAICAAAAGWWVYRLVRREAAVDAKVALVALLFPGGLLVLFGLGYFIPAFLDRYTIYSLVFWPVVLALAIHSLPGRWVRIGMAALILVGLGATLRLAPDKRSEWKEVADYLQAHRKEGEVVLVYPAWCKIQLAYHYVPEAFKDWEGYPEKMAQAGVWGVMKYTPLADLPIDSAGAVWVVSAGDEFADLHADVQNVLDTQFARGKTFTYPHNITVREYR